MKKVADDRSKTAQSASEQADCATGLGGVRDRLATCATRPSQAILQACLVSAQMILTACASKSDSTQRSTDTASNFIPAHADGMRISFDSRDNSLPCQWSSSRGFHANEVSLDQRDIASAVLQVGLDQIPPLRSYLRSNSIVVCLYRDISINNITVDGIYGRGVICISACTPDGSIRSASTIQAILCHEASSFPWNDFNRTFPIDAWQMSNLPEFRYAGSVIDWIRQHPSSIATDDDGMVKDELEAGFLRPYCRSSLENDFNVISSVLLPTPAYCIELSRPYPRLHQKVILAAQFWSTVIPDMKEYFEARVGYAIQPKDSSEWIITTP